MDNRDQLICDAFYDIVSTRMTELKNKLGEGISLTIATYLDEVPSEQKYDYEVMAQHISKFCYQPGNKILKEYLKDIYKTKAGEDLNIAVEKNKSPGRKSMLPRENNEMLVNSSRDSLRGLNDWKTSILTQQNNDNNTNERPQN